MNSRDKILSAIRKNKPERTVDAPMQIMSLGTGSDLAEEFCRMLESIGGRIIRIKDLDAVRKDLAKSVTSGSRIINQISEIGSLDELDPSAAASDLSNIEKTYLKSQLGVAENGAVWITEKEMKNRLLPFITQHLVILLEIKDLVANMHDAYSKISRTDAGYHVFIAGPSKTADIEQSLVIGAHGPRSMLIYLIG